MPEKRLWAPWRLEYIKGPKDGECIFCVGPESGDDRAKYVVRRGEHCFTMLNAYPYNNGHLMVSPYRHVASIEELEGPELVELMTLTQESLGALRRAYAPEGFVNYQTMLFGAAALMATLLPELKVGRRLATAEDRRRRSPVRARTAPPVAVAARPAAALAAVGVGVGAGVGEAR